MARSQLNRVHMSPKRARVSGERERERVRGLVYLACIHMQIPIDMTTFTYCIFALDHILARQFPIVGFRPPVRLIDIIGRAADTRLHFYLHTFANQFEAFPLPPLAERGSTTVHMHTVFIALPPSPPVVPTRFAFFRPPPASTIGRRFSSGCRALRARLYTRVMFPRAGMRDGKQVRRR